jgi:hypothetical protein
LTPDADAAAALLRTLGASGRTGRRIEQLTARELEVLDLLGEGLSNRRSPTGYISPKTAGTREPSSGLGLGLGRGGGGRGAGGSGG